jgi:hypothetical protein
MSIFRGWQNCCEANQVSIRVLHNENASAPWLGPQSLVEGDAGVLKLQKKRFDIIQRERC